MNQNVICCAPPVPHDLQAPALVYGAIGSNQQVERAVRIRDLVFLPPATYSPLFIVITGELEALDVSGPGIV